MSFPDLEPVCSSMSSSNCCFLTCIQISQEAGQVVWYSYVFQNFPVYCDPHSQRLWHSQYRHRCFFWNSLAFSMIHQMLAVWFLVPLPFLKPAWTSGSSRFMYCCSLAWRILSITLVVCKYDLSNGSVEKNPPDSAGDPGLFPCLQRSPGEGNGNLLQYSCLKNPMDGRAW